MITRDSFITDEGLAEKVLEIEAKLNWLMRQQRVQISKPTGFLDPKTNQPVAQLIFDGTMLDFYESQPKVTS